MDNQAAERDQDVITYETFSGLRNDVSPERFGPGDLYIANNIDLDRTGRMSRRAGFTNVLPGPIHSVWSSDEEDQCLFVSGGQVTQLNPDFTSSPLALLTAPLEPVSFVKVNDRVYFANGVDTGVVEQGAVRSWGIAPPLLPGVEVISGAMFAGQYQVAMTYFRSDAQESGAVMAATVAVPANGGLALTLPVSTDPGVSAKGVYISPANGEDLYLAAIIPNDQINAQFLGQGLDLDLPLVTQFLQQAPAGQLVAYYRGRLFVAQGDVLYPSEPFAYEQFDPRNYIQMDSRITMLAPMTDKELSDAGRSSGFFVGTDRSSGVLVGSSPEDFQYVPKTDYGAVFGALDFVDGSLFDTAVGTRKLPIWLSTQGICVGMPDMAVQNLTRSKFGDTPSRPGGAFMQAKGRGAALFLAGPNRFIATCNF